MLSFIFTLCRLDFFCLWDPKFTVQTSLPLGFLIVANTSMSHL